MSIKISFMHYRSYITWTRVKSAVAFEEFDMVYLIWLLVSFHYHCQSFSICKRSALAKIQGGCRLQPHPRFLQACISLLIDIYNSEITVLTTQSTAQRQKSQGKGDVRFFFYQSTWLRPPSQISKTAQYSNPSCLFEPCCPQGYAEPSFRHSNHLFYVSYQSKIGITKDNMVETKYSFSKFSQK